MTAPGFYGKLPLKGDFIQRGLDRTLTGSWDAWLQSCMDASRAKLGDSWLNSYLVSPLWRFAIAQGVMSQHAILGVVMPSVDSVGRHFPLMIAVEIPADDKLLETALANDMWFERIEDLALYGLSPEFEMSEFERRLEQSPFTANGLLAKALPMTEGRMGWSHSGHRSSELLLSGLAAQFSQSPLVKAGGFSVWWTLGSDQVEPSFVLYNGLPPHEDYASFLNGDWSRG